MTEQSTQSILIDAPPAVVMSVIADFENYRQWASSLKKVEVLELGADGRARRVAFTLDAGVIRDQYELTYRWDGDRKVEWTLTSGQMMRAQEGAYTLAPHADGTHVTYSLSVDLIFPMLGTLKRKGERIVMDQALKELKKHIESSRQ